MLSMDGYLTITDYSVLEVIIDHGLAEWRRGPWKNKVFWRPMTIMWKIESGEN